MCLHASMSLNNEKNCREILKCLFSVSYRCFIFYKNAQWFSKFFSEDKIAVFEKTTGLRTVTFQI